MMAAWHKLRTQIISPGAIENPSLLSNRGICDCGLLLPYWLLMDPSAAVLGDTPALQPKREITCFNSLSFSHKLNHNNSNSASGD
ncbi:hypothetical protein A7M48_20105 [Acinetobacter baumannii]|nr:hypothetical protein A7M48_20105 [Acinetobacter baumannii]